MDKYQYSKFAHAKTDIRLLHLHPGEFDDALRATISHAALTEPPGQGNSRLSLSNLRATLPEGWRAFEAVEGRYIFEQPDQDLTTWTHPDPEISASTYDLAADNPYGYSQLKYEALSYTWGDEKNLATLQVVSNGQSSPVSVLEIQPNLADSLKHLRHQSETRTLWVDAVCINQNDTAERNAQVSRMASIYKLAYRVVVWLGARAPDSSLALKTLEEIGMQLELSKCATRLRSPGATYPDWFLSNHALPYSEAAWCAITDLVSRPWFDRVWIVQEVQLANPTAIVQCGSDHLTWAHFRKAIWCILRKTTPPHAPLAKRLATIKILARSLQGMSFRHLLYGSSARLCSDQRDRVYGLLGLASPPIARLIRPQYASNISAVYIDAFLAILQHSNRLDALQDCGPPTHTGRPSGLPSWVPDWSTSVELCVGVLNSLYSGSGVSGAKATFQSPKVLEVCGVLSGKVIDVKGPPPKDERDMLAAIKKWAPRDLGTAVYPTGETTAAAYCLVLSLGMVRNRFPAAGTILPTLEELQTEMRNFTATAQLPSDTTPPPAFRRILGNLKDRVFIMLQDGYFGLAPAGTEPGDIIYTILGCRDPILLRPVANMSYLVIGACHFHGLSDAETLLGPLPAPHEFRVKLDGNGQRVHFVYDPITGESCKEDPRLGSLPMGWESMESETTDNEADRVAWFRCKATNATINSDPRLLPEFLEQRGVRVETIKLV